MKPYKILAIICCSLYFNSTIWAQKTLEDAANIGDDKLAKLVKLKKLGKPDEKWGQSMAPALRAKPPKKVALVSFYVYDKGSTSSYGTYMSGKTIITRKLTKDGASHFATSFHEKGISDLQAAFKTQGMDLLLPEDYLTSNEKVNAYNNFEYEVSAVSKVIYKAMMGFASAAGGTEGTSATAAGYRYLPAADATMCGDPKAIKVMGELARQLEVDAVMAIMNTCIADKKGLMLTGMDIRMYGPNLIPKKKGHMYPGLTYNTGQQYGGGYMNFKSGLPIAKFSKKGVRESEQYDGYEKLLGFFGGKVAEDIALRSLPKEK